MSFRDLFFSRNIFTFSNGKTLEYYLQTNGVSMGSKCAPAVACLYMADFEERCVYPYATQPLLWKRYIDDIFIIWTHGDTTLDAFVSYLNNCHPSIKFTVTKSTLQVDFLDLIVKKTKDGISTELFIKPTSSLAYLHRTSCRRRHVFTSLPYGEFLRVRRNCSEDSTFDQYADRLKQAFCTRGYDPQEIQTALDKARPQDRTQLLSKGIPTDNYPLVSDEDTSDEVEQFADEINDLILDMFNNGEIDSYCYRFLEQINPKPGHFYMLAKIHKNTLPPPGRPIVSAIGSPTEKNLLSLIFFCNHSCLASCPSSRTPPIFYRSWTTYQQFQNKLF